MTKFIHHGIRPSLRRLAPFANIATRLGSTLQFDPAKEQFIGNAEANQLLRRTYRDGHWAVPEGVA